MSIPVILVILTCLTGSLICLYVFWRIHDLHIFLLFLSLLFLSMVYTFFFYTGQGVDFLALYGRSGLITLVVNVVLIVIDRYKRSRGS